MTPARRAPTVARLRLATLLLQREPGVAHARVDALALALEVAGQDHVARRVRLHPRQQRLEPAPKTTHILALELQRLPILPKIGAGRRGLVRRSTRAGPDRTGDTPALVTTREQMSDDRAPFRRVR